MFVIFVILQAIRTVPGTVVLQGQQPFCQVCNRSFCNIDNLNEHIKSLHCSYCGKGFKAKRDLQGHLATHTGIREFKCHVCGKEFAYKQTLYSHILLHEMISKKLQD